MEPAGGGHAGRARHASRRGLRSCGPAFVRSSVDSFGRSRVERDLSDELDFHLKARTDHWVGQGLPPNEAARRARLEFGSVERYKEASRHARGLRWHDEMLGDVRYGIRTLSAARGFTFVAVAMLAIAIGANIAVFTVLDAVLFRMLPVERPQELRELAWIEGGYKGWSISYDGSMRPFPGGGRIAYSFSYPAYASMRDRSTTFRDLFLFNDQSMTVGMAGRDERATTLVVSGNFAGALGVGASLGRPISPEDDRPGAPPVAVLNQRGLAAVIWERSACRRSDRHDQRRVRGDRRRHAAAFLRARPGGPSTCSRRSCR